MTPGSGQSTCRCSHTVGTSDVWPPDPKLRLPVCPYGMGMSRNGTPVHPATQQNEGHLHPAWRGLRLLSENQCALQSQKAESGGQGGSPSLTTLSGPPSREGGADRSMWLQGVPRCAPRSLGSPSGHVRVPSPTPEAGPTPPCGPLWQREREPGRRPQALAPESLFVFITNSIFKSRRAARRLAGYPSLCLGAPAGLRSALPVENSLVGSALPSRSAFPGSPAPDVSASPF